MLLLYLIFVTQSDCDTKDGGVIVHTYLDRTHSCERYPQWQLRTVAQHEEKCRAPRDQSKHMHDNSPGDM